MAPLLSSGDIYEHKEEGTQVEILSQTLLMGDRGYNVRVIEEEKQMFLPEENLDEWKQVEEQ